MNKSRNKDKWILPKNNKRFERHRVYVAFVIYYAKLNGKYPTIQEYKDNIVNFLRFTGVNKKTKKTAENHQLFQPIFFNMLEEKDGVIIPTFFGILLMLDDTENYISEITYELFKSASFKTGATGSTNDYDNVQPVKLLFDNLIKYGSLTFEELNTKFHTKSNSLDIKSETKSEDKEPKWAYVLSMLEHARLIKTSDNVLNVSTKNPKYDSKATIQPTHKLLSLVTISNIKEVVTPLFKIDNLESIIEDVVANTKHNNTANQSSKRNPVDQSAYRSLLIERFRNCCICGIENPKLLIASHIKPYKHCEEKEEFDINNGLLLCSGHDALFDKGLMSFISGEVVYSENMTHHDLSVFRKITPENVNLILNPETEQYMKYHNENILK